MLCERCGATNSAMAQVCKACGYPLNTRQKSSLAEPLAVAGSDPDQQHVLPIDERPTARVPGVAHPEGFAPVSQLPFTSEFPLEAESPSPVSETSDDADATLVAPLSPSMFVPRGISALPGRPRNDVSLATPPATVSFHAPSVAGLPSESPVPAGETNQGVSSSLTQEQEQTTRLHPHAVPHLLAQDNPTLQFSSQAMPSQQEARTLSVSTPQAIPYAQENQFSSPPQDASAETTLLASRGPQLPQISTQTAPDAALPFSLAGMYPINTSANQPSQLPSQQNLHAPVEAYPMSKGRELSYPLNQAGGMGVQASPMAMNYPPASAPYISGPLTSGPLAYGAATSQAEWTLPAPPIGDEWYDYPTQTPPVAERLGNVYPGPSPVSRASSGVASQGGIGAVAGTPLSGGLSPLLHPLPRWAMVIGPLVGAAVLAGITFLYADWATGAVVAVMVAITLAILLGIAAGVRISLGMLKASNPYRRGQVVSSSLLIGLLLLFSLVGISQQNSLHMAQARYLESHQSWAPAIAEYQAAGEKSNVAEDVARTYNEWGEQQERQQQYIGAVTSFTTVIQNYAGATNELRRAQSDSIATYIQWASQAAQTGDYIGATTHYDILLTQSYCDVTCKSQVQPKDATAYYHLAEQFLAQQQYIQAANSYQTLSTRFPNAPEVSQIHAHYAQALWGKGQQELNTTCADALAAYRLLVKSFSDTSQGRQAARALAQPVGVKGHFTQTIPGAPYHPTAYLVQGLFVGIQPEQFPALLAGAPSAAIHSDGTFSFTAVPQSKYELVWSSDGTLHFYYAFSGQHVLYTAQPGPLCTYDYGDINQAIPT